MTLPRPDSGEVRSNLFSRLLPLEEAIPRTLIDEAALPLSYDLANSDPASASKAAHLACQSVHVIALNGPAIRTIIKGRRFLSLIYVEYGLLELLHPQHTCCCKAGTWVLVPECSFVWRSTAFHVICVLMPPELIGRSIEGCHTGAQRRPVSTLPDWPRAYHTGTENVGGVVLEMLTALLHAANQLNEYDPVLLDRLAIGDQIGRLLAVLIDPMAVRPASTDPSKQDAGQEDDYFDAMIRYIKSNLGQSLNLTVLANQTNYSRRTLQYAFRNRLGCTATQWIRGQRLDLAWQRLQAPGPEESVTSIAQDCGYRSLSLFSIEFQHRFHIKPSVLLRRTRTVKELHGPGQDGGENAD